MFPRGQALVAEQRDTGVVGRVPARGGLERAVPVDGDVRLLELGDDLLELGAQAVARSISGMPAAKIPARYPTSEFFKSKAARFVGKLSG